MLGRRQNSVSIRQRQGVENQENVTGKVTLLGAKPVLGKTGANAGIQTRARAALGDKSNILHLENIRKNEMAVKEVAAAKPQPSIANSLVTRARRLAKTTSSAGPPRPKIQAVEQNVTQSEDMEVDQPTVMEDMVIEYPTVSPTKTDENQISPDSTIPYCDRVFPGRQLDRERIRDIVLKKYGGGPNEAGPTSAIRVTNPDLIEMGNAQMVSEYVYDIFDHLQDTELMRMPLKLDFMDHCTLITTRMRYVLVDWMVQIHARFEMLPETLYLAVGMMDRFLSTTEGGGINKGNLQLLGVTAMMVAAKFEEMYPPDVTDFTYVTGNAYNCKDLREFEWTLLSNIGFYCTIPTPITFLRRFSRLLQVSGEMHSAAKYFLELTTCEYSLCGYPACLRAAAAITLSVALIKYSETFDKTAKGDVTLETLMTEAWIPNIQYTAAYDISEVIPVARKIAQVVERQSNPSKYRSIYKKYIAPEVHAVALRPEFNSQLMKNFSDSESS